MAEPVDNSAAYRELDEPSPAAPPKAVPDPIVVSTIPAMHAAIPTSWERKTSRYVINTSFMNLAGRTCAVFLVFFSKCMYIL